MRILSSFIVLGTLSICINKDVTGFTNTNNYVGNRNERHFVKRASDKIGSSSKQESGSREHAESVEEPAESGEDYVKNNIQNDTDPKAKGRFFGLLGHVINKIHQKKVNFINKVVQPIFSFKPWTPPRPPPYYKPPYKPPSRPPYYPPTTWPPYPPPPPPVTPPPYVPEPPPPPPPPVTPPPYVPEPPPPPPPPVTPPPYVPEPPPPPPPPVTPPPPPVTPPPPPVTPPPPPVTPPPPPVTPPPPPVTSPPSIPTSTTPTTTTPTTTTTTPTTTTPTTTTTTLPTTTPPPDYCDINEKCKPGEALQKTVGSGSYQYTIDRIQANSKFVYIGRPGTIENTFDKVTEECKKWKLELAQIKTPLGLKNIAKFMQRYKNFNTTFYISGTDRDHEGRWMYTPDNKIDIYNAFWGFSPKSFETVNKPDVKADKLMLHWTDDSIVKEKTLAMMDIDGDNEYCQMKSFICQFNQDHECFKSSDEEKALKEITTNKDTLKPLISLEKNSIEISISAVQKSMIDAKKLCELNGKGLLDMRLTKRESLKLHEALYKWLKSNDMTGGTTGFWVGPHTLFRPGCSTCVVNWEWITNIILDPWSDHVLTCGNRDARKGCHQHYGTCLAIGILKKEPQVFSLQKAPCDILQWTLCTGNPTVPPIPTTPKNLTEICDKEYEQNNGTTIWRREEVPEGNYTIEKVGEASKFVFFSSSPSAELSFDAATQECVRWGLEMAEIKSPHGHSSLVKYFKSNQSAFTDDSTTFWISGTDADQEGFWTYHSATGESTEFFFHAFYGLGPQGIATVANTTSGANNLMLHWVKDTLTKEKTLVMMDVEGDNVMYEKKSFVCQFLEGSQCHNNSVEEQLFLQWEIKNGKCDLLLDLGKGREICVGPPELFIEIKNYCPEHGMELLDLRSLTKSQVDKLYTSWQKWIKTNGLLGLTTGFWVGSHDLFAGPHCRWNWNWMNNEILDPWKDTVLKYGSSKRKGQHRSYGKCLAMGTLKKEPAEFHLQRVPCLLPQWVLCMTPPNGTVGTTTTPRYDNFTTTEETSNPSTEDPSNPSTEDPSNPSTEDPSITSTTPSDGETTPAYGRDLSVLCNKEFVEHGKSIWRKEIVEDGNYTIEKMGDESRFVFFTNPPSADRTYQNAASACVHWGLEIATVESFFGHQNIVKFIKSQSESFTKMTAFWISGTNEGHPANWLYTSGLLDDFHFHSWMVGNLPRTCKIGNLMLHWGIDTLNNKEKTLLMTVVEANDTQRFEQKSFICQFKKGTACDVHSIEERTFLEKREKASEKFVDLGAGLDILISLYPMPYFDVYEFCENLGRQPLDLRNIKKSQASKLFTAWQKWMKSNSLIGSITGFWFGAHNLFRPNCELQWDWIENVLFQGWWSDKYEDTLQPDNFQSEGQCLFMSTLRTDPKIFHLHKSLCSLPQFVLCVPNGLGSPVPPATESFGETTTDDV